MRFCVVRIPFFLYFVVQCSSVGHLLWQITKESSLIIIFSFFFLIFIPKIGGKCPNCDNLWNFLNFLFHFQAINPTVTSWTSIFVKVLRKWWILMHRLQNIEKSKFWLFFKYNFIPWTWALYVNDKNNLFKIVFFIGIDFLMWFDYSLTIIIYSKHFFSDVDLIYSLRFLS